MDNFLNEARFAFISEADKAFMLAFDREMTRMGYGFGDQIGSGYCWGKYMAIYTRTGVKSKVVTARIYIRENGLVLRLFLNGIDKHRTYIEQAPAHIKDVFTNEVAACRHDRDDSDGKCMFRKSYTIDGRLIEKCNGETFEFRQPNLEKLPDYMGLYREFFAPKRGARSSTIS